MRHENCVPGCPATRGGALGTRSLGERRAHPHRLAQEASRARCTAACHHGCFTRGALHGYSACVAVVSAAQATARWRACAAGPSLAAASEASGSGKSRVAPPHGARRRGVPHGRHAGRRVSRHMRSRSHHRGRMRGTALGNRVRPPGGVAGMPARRSSRVGLEVEKGGMDQTDSATRVPAQHGKGAAARARVKGGRRARVPGGWPSNGSCVTQGTARPGTSPAAGWLGWCMPDPMGAVRAGEARWGAWRGWRGRPLGQP